MAEQISLDETNRIRKSLGLAPIGEPSNIEKSHETDATQISVEETNKIRARLGLKPIPVENGKQTQISEDQENENWKKFQDDERKVVEQKKLAKKVKEAKDQAARLKQLQGDTILNDHETDTVGVKSWLKKFREKQKQAASKRYDEEDELPTYNEQNIDGFKVGHKKSQLEALNQDAVLTLKDQSVLDDEDDELVSSKLQEQENLEENLANKKGKSKYRDETEMNEDEDAEKDYFLLNGSDIPSERTKKETAIENGHANLQKMSLDLDMINGNETSTDYQEAPAKFKRFKPKKTKITEKKRKRLDDDDENIIPVENDDFDLQSTLAASRKNKLKAKQRRIQTPDEIAERVLSTQNETDNENETGFRVSSTTDFLGFIRKAKEDFTGIKNEPIETIIKKEENTVPVDQEQSEETGRVPVKQESSEESSKVPIKQEPSDEEVQTNKQKSSQHSEDENVMRTPVKKEFDDPILDSDSSFSRIALQEDNLTVGGSMAEALRLLRDKGAVSSSSQDSDRQRKQAEWHKALERKRSQIAADFDKRREKARQEAGWDRLNAKERAQLVALEKEQFEEELSRESRALYRNYQPVVNIEYHDELGNRLNEREAYKHLSHQFHGNKSGKRKVEKQIRKREEQLKKESQSIFENTTSDTSGQKKPGIRLL